MTRIPFLAATLLGTVLLSPAPTQVQTFGGSFPRMSTRILYFGETAPLGQISIQYGQPDWKPEYDRMLTEAKGTTQRLGRDVWTSLDTDLDLTIGGTEVPAGQWYLGLSIGEDGELSLMVMEAAAVRAQKGDAFMTDQCQAKINAPLKHTRTDEQVDKLTIFLATEGKELGQADLEITWGTHKMTAALTANVNTGDNPQPRPTSRPVHK
jgi:hypothetical protein